MSYARLIACQRACSGHARNTCRMAFWARFHTFNFVKKLNPLHKSCGFLYSKRLQADGLSTFSYFGFKLFIAYHMLTGTLKQYSGRRFEQVAACSIMCRVCLKHLPADVFEQVASCSMVCLACPKHLPAGILGA